MPLVNFGKIAYNCPVKKASMNFDACKNHLTLNKENV